MVQTCSPKSKVICNYTVTLRSIWAMYVSVSNQLLGVVEMAQWVEVLVMQVGQGERMKKSTKYVCWSLKKAIMPS